ncbi:unnamed protein product [Rotaria sp. Silwood2]|nr:unnamed protein product [Rotaria sp. Silwood2]CAF3476682.1 unnamed protein product [Rotaria sp. Silwood2]CAF4455154.1 unnamed protein product [Rotaria sp. Silwood2]CAF4545160.1 unnamed protein product [Rotaria sp. Silwood2]
MTSKLLARNELERLIKQNDLSITLKQVEQTDRASSFWSQFNLICVNKIVQNFVICNICQTIITYRSATGTGGLKKHSISCKKTSSPKATQSTITTYYGKKPSIVPVKLKKQITDAYVDFILLDSRPFKIVSDVGFRQLLQIVYNAGKCSSNLGVLDFADALPHPTTVSRQIDQIYDVRKKQLVDWCRTLDTYAITVDMWTEKFSGIHFCGVTIRHVDINFYLHSYCLGCKPYTLANQTASNVRKFLDDLLLEYGLSLNENSFITTDNEPKMIAALRGANRIGCADHYINKILEHSFTISNSNCTEVIQVFEAVKSLVGNFRRCHRQIKLSRKLQTFSSTRFSGAYFMLNVFNSIYDELIDVFSGSHSNNFESIDRDLLSDLCQFLQRFDQIITILSDETQPNLYKVIPLRDILIDHCVSKSDDIFEQDIVDKWPIQQEHLIATFIHPRLRDFSGNDSLRKQAIEALQSAVASCTNTSSNSSTNRDESSSSTNDTSASVVTQDLLSLCYDKPRADKIIVDEVLLWSQSIFDTNTINNDDLLSFWRNKKDEFPKIAVVARRILAIPAFNTSVERLFSSAKLIVNERRTRLGIEKIDKLMFLKKNITPLQHMFDSKNSSTPFSSKRKSNDINDNDMNNNDDESLFLKKLKFDKEDDYNIISDESESEKDD